MRDGSMNKRSGIVVVNLPEVSNDQFWTSYGDSEKNCCARKSRRGCMWTSGQSMNVGIRTCLIELLTIF